MALKAIFLFLFLWCGQIYCIDSVCLDTIACYDENLIDYTNEELEIIIFEDYQEWSAESCAEACRENYANLSLVWLRTVPEIKKMVCGCSRPTKEMVNELSTVGDSINCLPCREGDLKCGGSGFVNVYQMHIDQSQCNDDIPGIPFSNSTSQVPTEQPMCLESMPYYYNSIAMLNEMGIAVYSESTDIWSLESCGVACHDRHSDWPFVFTRTIPEIERLICVCSKNISDIEVFFEVLENESNVCDDLQSLNVYKITSDNENCINDSYAIPSISTTSNILTDPLRPICLEVLNCYHFENKISNYPYFDLYFGMPSVESCRLFCLERDPVWEIVIAQFIPEFESYICGCTSSEYHQNYLNVLDNVTDLNTCLEGDMLCKYQEMVYVYRNVFNAEGVCDNSFYINSSKESPTEATPTVPFVCLDYLACYGENLINYDDENFEIHFVDHDSWSAESCGAVCQEYHPTWPIVIAKLVEEQGRLVCGCSESISILGNPLEILDDDVHCSFCPEGDMKCGDVLSVSIYQIIDDDETCDEILYKIPSLQYQITPSPSSRFTSDSIVHLGCYNDDNIDTSLISFVNLPAMTMNQCMEFCNNLGDDYERLVWKIMADSEVLCGCGTKECLDEPMEMTDCKEEGGSDECQFSCPVDSYSVYSNSNLRCQSFTVLIVLGVLSLLMIS